MFDNLDDISPLRAAHARGPHTYLVWIGEPTGCHPDDQQHRCTAVSKLDAVNDAERAGLRGPVWCVCEDGPVFEVFEYVIPEGE